MNFGASFRSQELRGTTPALLSLGAMMEFGAIINTRTHTLTLHIDAGDACILFISTKSGRYDLPLDVVEGTDHHKYDREKMNLISHMSACEDRELEALYGEGGRTQLLAINSRALVCMRRGKVFTAQTQPTTTRR